MGASALAGPVPIDGKLIAFDIWVMLATSVALLVFVMRRQPIGRKTGFIFVAGYILYMLALLRGVM